MSRHLALYTDDPDKGGVAQYNHNVLLALAARGHRVTCVQPFSESPLVRQQQAAGIRHEWIGYDPGRDFTRSITDTADAAERFGRVRPDLVLFSDCCPVSNLAAKQVALAQGRAVLIVVHFVAAYLAERFRNCLPVMARQHARARQVVAVSQENLGQLHQRFGTPRDKGVVIHNGRPAAYFAPPEPEGRRRLRAELGLPDSAVVCLAAARLTAIKGFQHIVAAAARLHGTPAGKDLYYVWAGEGELRGELQRHIEALGLGPRFRLLGQRWDVCDLYAAADLFTLPSHFEGMPLTVMEAMARGVPVVATAVSGIPEELGDAGRLLPDPEINPEATVRALAEALADWALRPEARRVSGAKGRARAQAMFREERMLGEVLALVEGQLPSAGGGAG